jgi:hypothetical protein
MRKKLIGAGIAMAVALNGAIAGEERIAFPANYRTTMVNYVSLDRTQNPDQMIRLFAPQVALDSAKAGKDLPDGTVLVAEIYKAKQDDGGEVMTSSLGRRMRDKFAAIAVMQKGNGWGETFPAELRNGDWDFAIFSPKGERLANKDLNECRACHAPLTKTQHLFSLEHME